MLASMWAIFVIREPLFVLLGMATMPTIFTPNNHPLIQSFLAKDTQELAFAVPFCHRLFTPPTRYFIGGIFCRDL